MSTSAEEALEKCAIVMLAIGEAQASKVMKYFSAAEVQLLGAHMARTGSISKARIEEVATEVVVRSERRSLLGLNNDAYVRNVVTSALGEEKAAFLLHRILQGSQTSGIEGLRWMDPTSIYEMIQKEHPQIIATILAHLERGLAANILNLFSERTRADLVWRVATLDGVQPAALKDLNDVLSRLISGGDKLRESVLGGTRAAAEILNFVGISSEKTVLDLIREQDSELAERIEEDMFTFENLLDIDDRGMQLLVREVPSDIMALAMKGADDTIYNKLTRNMTSRAADGLSEDMELLGPVRISEVEAAQKELLGIVRRLVEEQRITLNSGGVKDLYV